MQRVIEPVTKNFINTCRSKRGSIQWDKDGLFLTCQSGYEGYPVNYPEMGDMYNPNKNTVYPSTKLMDESDLLYAQLQQITPPVTEIEKLRLYFRIVYPYANPRRWKQMSLSDLQSLWQSLELYYKLDPAFMPSTPRTIRQNNKFYQVPDANCSTAELEAGTCTSGNVWLSQETGRPVETGPYMEVIRFGDMDYTLLPDATFTATYLYPAKGSGLFLPTQNSLIAWNKVHALRLLGVSDADIAYVAGSNFWFWVQTLSDEMVADMGFKDCPRDNAGHRTCYEGFDTVEGTRYYVVPDAVYEVIDNMSAGQSLNKSTKSPYYGLGGSKTGGDALVARLALQEGYDTVQFIQEAQLGSSGIVGFEVIDLRTPRQTSALLTRIDPFLLWDNNPFLFYNPHRTYTGYADYLLGTQMMQSPSGGLYQQPVVVTTPPNLYNDNIMNNEYYSWLESEGGTPSASCNIIGTPPCP